MAQKWEKPGSAGAYLFEFALADCGCGFLSELTQVLSVADSYADEAFGVLAAEHGLEWFARRVRVQASRSVLAAIARAIRNRFEVEGVPLSADLSALDELPGRRPSAGYA